MGVILRSLAFPATPLLRSQLVVKGSAADQVAAVLLPAELPDDTEAVELRSGG